VEAVNALCLWAPAHPELTLGRYGWRSAQDARAAFTTGFAGLELPPGVRFDTDRKVLDIGGNPVSSAFFEDIVRHDPLESARRHRGSSLVVHGAADAAVPARIGERYARALETRLHVIDGAGHTFDSLPHQREVHRVTLEFFEQVL
jgi:pimeloyl-ACP methyl ester carboxylesterase